MQKMVKNNFRQALIVFVLTLALGLFAYLVSALLVMTNPVTDGNYSSTIRFDCTSTPIASVINITIYYNETGETAFFKNSTEQYGHAVLTSEVNTTNTTGDAYFNTSVSITGLSNSLSAYNFSCVFYNGTDVEDVDITGVAENVTIDNTAPNVSSINDPSTNYNATGTINISATVNDTSLGTASLDLGYGIDSVYFNLTNSTADEVLLWKVDIADGGHYNGTYNDSLATANGTFPDGSYTLRIWANDTMSNVNITESVAFTIDNNGPTVSLSQSEVTGDSMKIKITPDDGFGTGTTTCSSNRGTLTLFSVSDTGLGCGTSYSYTITCVDFQLNTNSKTSSFSTEDCSSSPGGVTGAAGAAVPKKTYTITEEQFTTGYTKQLAKDEKIKLVVEKEEHSIKVSEVLADKVKIIISSDPQEAILSLGETKKFDITGDGLDDLSVTLNSITTNKADLTVKSISKEEAAKKEEIKAEIVEKKSLLWLWILVIVVAIVIAYFLYKKARR